MKIIAVFIMSGVLLGGCASFYEFRNKVRERRLARYQSECSRYGYKYGSPHMAQCVESKYKERSRRLNEPTAFDKLLEERRRRELNCTTTIIGNRAYTRCD